MTSSVNAARETLSDHKNLKNREWDFDLDDTLHDASSHIFGQLRTSMTDYVVRHLAVTQTQANQLRHAYWQRYGATLLGLVRHHAVDSRHFLQETHRLPELERHLRCHQQDRAALARLPGRKFVLTNAPAQYAWRVLTHLRLAPLFDGVICVEQMRMFGHLRPKPDARMLRFVLARLKLKATNCVLVEDTLAHQKSANRLHMHTIWMQRWLKTDSQRSRLHRRPAYVGERVTSLMAIRRCHRSLR